MNLFIDDGGVLSDPARRPPQYERLVGEFFPPRLGGTPEAWMEANRLEVRGIYDRFPAVMGRDSLNDWSIEYRAYQLAWLRLMAGRAGVAAPESDDACFDLAVEASVYMRERADTAYPGAAEALRTLHAAGHALYTSSGTVSNELEAILRSMGVRELFSRICSPDLVGTGKGHPRFMERVFAHAGVAPRTAVIVDDGPFVLQRAAALGARTVLVSPEPTAADGIDLVIGSLAELPALLPKLG